MATKLGFFLIVATLMFPATYCTAEDQSDAEKAVAAAKAIKAAFELGQEIKKHCWDRHPTVDTFKVGDKFYWVCGLLPSDESRCTNNITRNWDGGPRKFRVLFLNVPDDVRAKMIVQRKHDKALGEDGNRGPKLRHGESFTTDKAEIWDDYWAVRGDWVPKEVLKNSPSAAILVVEDGIDLSQVNPAAQKVK